jgi:hypothetical protein
LPFDEEEGTAAFLCTIYRTFKQTMIEANIWGAFQELGFEFDTSREPYRLSFDEEKLRRSPGFRAIWSLDFPFERLSTRRQRARFGWINRPEYMRMLTFAFDFIEEISRYFTLSDSRKSTFSPHSPNNSLFNSRYNITAFSILQPRGYHNNFSFGQHYKHQTVRLTLLPPER